MCFNILGGAYNYEHIKYHKLQTKGFYRILGVSVKTLQRWDREGILKNRKG